MSNAPDFSLSAELAATSDWDDDDFVSGYADEPDDLVEDVVPADGPDPEDLTTGAMDLAERHQLRRVASLRTELEDITEVEYRQLRLERVVLVGVWTEGSVADAENSMAELALLAETAGSEVLEALYQRRQSPDPATYVGRGKVEGIAEIVQATGADTVICDGELAPSQLRNLEDRLKVKVVDRTALILDIFAQHAKSREGQAQVELAQLSYMKQRLRGWGGNLSRQAGGRVAGGAGIGGRGPGETKIETDRRRINTKIAKLRRQLAQMKGTRDTMRSERRRNQIPSVAIAGYTNAGKSSLLNRLTDAGVLVENALFATLDPTTRRTTTSDGRVYTMSDTVGFVRHLPHQLVEAFRSTLEEVADSDLILHVVDGSHPDPEGQIAAVREVFAEIGADKVPELLIVNKADIADEIALARLKQREPHLVVVSARTGEGIAEALRVVEGELPHPAEPFDVLVPYARGDLMNRIHQHAEIDQLEHTGDGTRVSGRANASLAGELAPYAAG
ncbi:GTP-binding protein HflX [Nocardioides zeae]|uniref:GTP-binding protein HflX n=2 Tax=Nocardioides zeae TaxID=1457234 RepID=A0ACC6IJX3_9ACTN|nr:GTPase HflX [Nocardioides zeae]MDQ1102718.1 GTP-binding protein HflX [Nocardioides zeae]MDR6173506.1 GTP-binding protein HflX [Nocardioides zeae]MDR6210912.1 GTP-binding protein HflX [Nocardioides zeae]